MSDRSRDNRDRDEEPTIQDGPKGFYRKDSPYDPFNNTDSGDGPERSMRDPHLHRRRRSKRNWRSMRPRPRETAEIVESRSHWLTAIALVIGFVGGFFLRGLMIPRESAATIPYVPEAPGTTALEKKPDLEEMERKTRQAIERLNKKVQDNALSASAPGVEAERMNLSIGDSKPEDTPILKLKPIPAE